MKLNNPELLRSQCLINGEWCDALSGKREAVINPATGAELASIPLVSEEETQQAIAAAQRAQNEWKQLTAKQRSALLLAWADKVLAAQEDLAQLMTAEQGKSLAEARGEVAYAASFITGSPKRPSGWTVRYCRRRRLRSAGGGEAADRRVRGHHPVEFPGGDDHPQGGAGAGGGLRHHRQTG